MHRPPTIRAIRAGDAPHRHVVQSTVATLEPRCGGHDWRFRVYFRGAGSTLADLVPILGQLGLQAVEEHPTVFTIGDPTVTRRDGRRPDVGVALRDRCAGRTATTSTMHGAPRCSGRSSGWSPGTIESDGLNRLILEGGLDTHQVAVLRLYRRYLRQVGFGFSGQYVEQSLVRQSAIARRS